MTATAWLASIMLVWCSMVGAQIIELGSVGDGRATFNPAEGLSGLTVTINGVSFRPLAGAGALTDDSEVDTSLQIYVEPKTADGVLRIAIKSTDPGIRGLDPGVVEGLGQWRRLNLSRQAMPYGQTWWPKTTYSVEGDFWFTAHWVMHESNSTSWQAANQAEEGAGPFPAALKLVYKPDTEGAYLPLDEVLEIRAARSLWDVVPYPSQAPSEYRQELADSVFVDFWGGRAADELLHVLQVIKALGRGNQRHVTILQNWQVGGWDALLPDSVWMPDYPPNPSVGTVNDLKALCELGKSMGRFGFRTNYRQLRPNSPSYQKGIARSAVGSDGKPLGYVSPSTWPAIAGRQEKEIRELFGPTAGFTDELTAGCVPSAWHDYAAQTGSRSMRATLERQRTLARLIKDTHQGPLGSESMMDQQLLGEYVDSGDFVVMNGHNRLFSPEFKLRRLNHLTAFHGMGLMYRFFEMPPFKMFHSGKKPYQTDRSLLDDYRCSQIMFGNGAYICYPFATWQHTITECLLVANLQRRYTLQPVKRVLYYRDGEWTSLQDMVRAGQTPNIVPWLPQSKQFGRIRLEYDNGLIVVVNRLPEPLRIPNACWKDLTLPQYGWVAWHPDGWFIAFSALWPTTENRVDYLRDDQEQIEYIDPRGGDVRGVSLPTFWEKGKAVIVADPESNVLRVDGQELALDPPAPDPLDSLDCGFVESLEGWTPGRGVLTTRVEDGMLKLTCISPDPTLWSPKLRLSGDRYAMLKVRMRISAGEMGQLYFETEEDPGLSAAKMRQFSLIADGRFHTYRIWIGSHEKWRGQTITRLRLDPVHGPATSQIEIDYVRAMPARGHRQ